MSDAVLKELMSTLKDIKDDLTCPICSHLCDQPKTFTSCCHTVCFKHIEETVKFCPVCGQDIKATKLMDDQSFEKSVYAFIQIQHLLSNNAVDTPTRQPTQKTKTKPDCRFSSNSLSKQDPSINNSIVNEKNRTLEKRNKKGETLLHIECRLGNIDKVKEHLSLGANPNTKDHAGWTPLHEAVQKGKGDIVALLLEYGSLPDVPGCDNETPLHEALRYGHQEIATLLVRYGADLTSRNIKGETPLQLCGDNELKTTLLHCEPVTNDYIHNITEQRIDMESELFKIYSVSKQRQDIEQIKLLCRSHNNLKLETKLTRNVTHVLVETDDNLTCLCNVDVLQATVTGKWIISIDWIHDSSEEKLENIIEYEVKGIGTINCNGPMRSRLNQIKQLPGLFDGCHFYFHNFGSKYEITKSLVLNKQIVSKLVTDAGGKVLKREPNPELIPECERTVPYHAKDGPLKECSHYIIFTNIYEPLYNMNHLKALPLGWFIECIEKFQLCEPW